MTFMPTTGQSPVSAPGPSGPLRMTPGRWVVLAVAVPVALALIGWTGFSLVASVARGSYPFSYAFPVRDGKLALNVSAGDITVRQAPASGTARLAGTVRYGLVRPGISEFTTSTSVNVSLNCTASIAGDCGVNANLDIPAQTGVTLWSNGGDVTASGFSHGMTLWTSGGNVNVGNLTGALQLNTGGGDLTANGLTGTLVVDTQGGNVNAGDWTSSGAMMQLNTGGGDMSVNGLSGDFQLITQGGNVDVSGLAAPTSATESGGGNVALAFSQVPKDVTITSQGGNVTVILPPNSSTKYNITTPDNQGGNIDIPSSLVAANSSNKITIDSGGGNITVSQG